MSSLSDFMGASTKPKLITSYTSGTGTYVPTADMARCFVRVQAGGGGGSYVGGSHLGGGGGAMVEFWCRVPIAGLAYAVGAGGTGGGSGIGGDGSKSSFGPYSAMQGFSGGTASVFGPQSGSGGVLTQADGSVDTDSVSMMSGNGLQGVSGGAGGNSSDSGLMVGFPNRVSNSLSTPNASAVKAYAPNGQGVSSGGDSFYGKGGLAGASPAATAYGAGGGGHATTAAAGRGGYIEVWDFGA